MHKYNFTSEQDITIIDSRICLPPPPRAKFWWTGPNSALGYLDIHIANFFWTHATEPTSRLKNHGTGNVMRSWPPGQQDCLQASGPSYPQQPVLCQQQPASYVFGPSHVECLPIILQIRQFIYVGKLATNIVFNTSRIWRQTALTPHQEISHGYHIYSPRYIECRSVGAHFPAYIFPLTLFSTNTHQLMQFICTH